MTRTRAIIQKEVRQIIRDPKSLGVILVLPALILVLYGYGLSFDPKNLPLWVLDYSQTARSRDYVAQFTHLDAFDFRGYLEDRAQIPWYLSTRRAVAVLVIPPDFSERIERGETAVVQAVIDGSNSSIAGQALAYLEGISRAYSASIQAAEITRRGIDPLHAMGMEPRVWYNPDLKSARFLLPGLMGYILAIVCVVATALSVVRERERGTMEQLAVSPLSPAELIIGKAVPYIVVAFLTGLLILATGMALFDLRVEGDLWLLFILLLIYTTCNLGLGLLISSIADSQQSAFQAALLVSLLPSMILSGFIYPISSMPVVLRGITYLVPARYFLSALRDIMLRGAGLEAFWGQILLLLLFTGLTLTISTLRIRKRLFGL